MKRKLKQRGMLGAATGIYLMGSVVPNFIFGALEMNYIHGQEQNYNVTSTNEVTMLEPYKQQIRDCIGMDGELYTLYKLLIPGQFSSCFPQRSKLENRIEEFNTHPLINSSYEDI